MGEGRRGQEDDEGSQPDTDRGPAQDGIPCVVVSSADTRFKAGDEITLVGKLAKDGRPRMILDKVVFANGQELATNDVPTPTIPSGQ